MHVQPAFVISAMALLMAACESPEPTATTSPSTAELRATDEATSTPNATKLSKPTATPRPTPTKGPAFTEREREALDELRRDARIDCAPRRTDLPTDADSGVECRVHSALVERVGVYIFPNPRLARAAYITRLTESGVDLDHGDCAAGQPGDSAWSDDQTAGDDDDDPRPARTGCFFNELGIANVRVTCGYIYIGIVGQDDDLGSLYEWAWRVAEGESTERKPPGICASSDWG